MTAANEFLFGPMTRAYLSARCVRCYLAVATYWAPDDDARKGAWHKGSGTCSCFPVPRLPEGGELDEHLDRAARRAHVGQGHAPVTIRVR